MKIFQLSSTRIKSVLCVLFLTAFTIGAFSQSVVEENFNDFKNNIANKDEVVPLDLPSGRWSLYYVDCKYSPVVGCAVLKHSSSKMGYIITPTLNAPQVLTFKARLQYSNTRSSSVDIQISEDEGPFISKGIIEIPPNDDRKNGPYKEYSINLNSTSNNVKIKFIRVPSPPEHSDYNIMIDDIQIEIANSNTTVPPPDIISPPVDCNSLVSFNITSPAACGESNGSISLVPKNSSDICSAVWKTPSGELIATGNTLSGIAAAQYLVEINCNDVRCNTVIPVTDRQQTMLLEENFEEFVSSQQINDKDITLHGKSWHFNTVDDQYSSGSANGNRLEKCVVLRHSSGKRGYLITPAVDAPKTLIFDARLQNWSEEDNLSYPDNAVEVLVSEDGGGWVSKGTVVIKPSQNGHRQDEPYTEYSIDLNSISNNVKIQILRMLHPLDQKSDLNIIIDNIKIAEACPNASIDCSSLDSYLDGSLNQSETLCYGGSIQLRAGVDNAVSYQWSPAGSLTNPNIANPIASPLVNTTYEVAITTIGGCKINKTVSVEVSSQFNLYIEGNETAVCKGEVQEFEVSGADDYRWEPKSGLSCYDCPNPQHTVIGDKRYTVSGIKDGCVVKLPVQVRTHPDKINFTYGKYGCEVHFETPVNSDFHQYEWSFGGAGTITHTSNNNRNVKYKYERNGTYKVCLKAKSVECEQEADFCLTINITPEECSCTLPCD